MSGAIWAAFAGFGFGLFQSVNGRATRGFENMYLATFLQLLVAFGVLLTVSLCTEDLAVLEEASAWAMLAFALAGMIHFFVGWTTLNLSHARIGAARTVPLLATTPLFGLALGVALADQVPSWLAVVGIALTIVGGYAVYNPGRRWRMRLRDSAFGVATACAWSTSAIFTVEGLQEVDSPLLGVTIGMFAAAVAYGLLLLFTPASLSLREQAREAIALKLLAGLIVALATWGRWLALDDADIAVVLAINLISIPVVLVASPIISGRDVEVVTSRTWTGAGLLAVGALLLIIS